MELTAGRKKLCCGENSKRDFQGDALSALLFVIAIMSLSYKLRKCISAYKPDKSKEKINHYMYIDNIKLFAKKEKELKTLIQAVRIYSDNMQSGYMDVIWHWKMCLANNERRKTTNEGRNRSIKPRQNQNARGKWEPTNNWEYSKRIPSNIWRWEKK